jgi:hypothetical protein
LAAVRFAEQELPSKLAAITIIGSIAIATAAITIAKTMSEIVSVTVAAVGRSCSKSSFC